MPLKLHHRLAFHALTASLVLNLVFMCLLHQFYAGKLTVQVAANSVLGIF